MGEVRVLGRASRASALVDDLVFRGPDDLDVEAFLVRPGDADREEPASRTRGPGLLLWHWLDTEAPDGNRTQFLDEAVELASAGVVSLLPQGRFPWSRSPGRAAEDGPALRAEIARLRSGLELLAGRPDVDPTRLGVVGHDFGGMLAILAAAEETRLQALVVVAATPRWGDWFLPFWTIADDRIDYLRAMRPLDPIERIAEAGPASVLFQFGERDFYIAPMSGLELHRAAPSGSEWRAYDTGHDMRLAVIRADRREFLAGTLAFGGTDGAAAG